MKMPGRRAGQVHAMGVGVAALLTVAAYVFGVEPRLDRDFRARRIEADVAGVERDALVALTRLRAERAMLGERRAALEASGPALESEAVVNDRMLRLARLAETAGLVVTALEPGSSRQSGQHTLIPARLSGTASFAAVATYIAGVRREFPDVRVDRVEIAGGAGSGPGAKGAVFELGLTWFTHDAGGNAGGTVRAVDASGAGGAGEDAGSR